MKKVILYTDTNHVGGAELQMLLLARSLEKSLYYPILVCSKNKNLDEWCEKFKKHNIKVKRISVFHKHDPRHYIMLRWIIKKEKVDLLHIHVWNTASGRYAFAAGKDAKIPIISTEHDVFKLSPIKAYIKKRSLKYTSKVIVPSKVTMKRFTDLYEDQAHKVKLIYPSIDTDWWIKKLSKIRKNDIKRIKENVFRAKENSLILITIANLNKHKRVDLTIKSISYLKYKFPDIKLIIVGDGKQKKKLKRLVKRRRLINNVIFLGKRNDIPELLKSSDMLISSSERESFGLTIIEALISKVVVLSSVSGIVAEIIGGWWNGLVIHGYKNNTLGRLIERTLKDEKLMKKLTKNGYDTVYNYFTMKAIAKNHHKIYKKVIEQYPSFIEEIKRREYQLYYE